MVALKSPLLGMEVNPDVGAYIGILERQVLALTFNELKFRALLEVLTEEEWDDMKTEFEEGSITRLAVRLVEQKLKVGNMEARKIVARRKEEARASSPLRTNQFS